MKHKNLFPLKALAAALFLLLLFGGRMTAADEAEGADPEATQLWPAITYSNGTASDALPNNYFSHLSFTAGDTITLESDTPMAGIYICWDTKEVQSWSLTLEDGTVQQCGTEGYLHEYVAFSSPSSKAVITLSGNSAICKLYAFSEGALPSWVQVWTPSCSEADILLISTHADDEQIFFGGILPYYAGELELQVQVVYFCNYWNGSTRREHEKLDGLWTVGVRKYPVNGDFDDLDVSTGGLEEAKALYDYDTTVGFMVEMIRRFRPLVTVGQDFGGEYGHGAHQLTAAALADALPLAADETSYPASAETYGTWDVPKAYFHVYGDDPIDLDCRRELSNFGGKTVLEVAADGYLQHKSQLWCWFYIADLYGKYDYDDSIGQFVYKEFGDEDRYTYHSLDENGLYKFSCGRFGLYRTLVGEDVDRDDLLEHVTTYEEQARLAEEESIAASVAASEAEASSLAEEASIAASLAESKAEAASVAESEAEADAAAAASIRTVLAVILVVVVALLLLSGEFIILYRRFNSKRRHRRKQH